MKKVFKRLQTFRISKTRFTGGVSASILLLLISSLATQANASMLVVGRTGDIDTLDPHKATAFQSVRTLELVYDSLLRLDADLNVGPGLAESWTFSDDGKSLTLNLRSGVQFHGGSSFDSGDVVKSLQRVMDESTGAVVRSNLLSIDSIAATDDNTVVLTLNSTDASILVSLADPNVSILSSEAIDAGTVDSAVDGTSAFRWDEWKQGASVTLTTNADYWGELPTIEGIELRVIPDESSILAGAKAGEIDIAVLTDPVVVMQATAPLTIHRTPALAYHALMLNGGREPLTDARVRQAISCAIDRQQVIDTAALGEGAITGPITIPAYKSDNDGLPCAGERDVDKARELLAEAGKADGFTLNTIVISGESSTGSAEGQNVQSQLKEVGINLELEVLETGIYVERWLAADFDIAVAQNSGKPDPHQMYARYWLSDGNLNKIAGYRSDRLDELMKAGNMETDPDKRKAIYDQLSEELSTQSPWVWMYTGYEYRVTNNGVNGFKPMPNGSMQYLRAVSIAK